MVVLVFRIEKGDIFSFYRYNPIVKEDQETFFVFLIPFGLAKGGKNFLYIGNPVSDRLPAALNRSCKRSQVDWFQEIVH